MRLLPRSLFARLAWVLLAGLIVAQLLSAMINFEERDRLLLSASGFQTAQRMADTVLLLESLSPAERQRIVAILNVPPQIVRLGEAPTASGSFIQSSKASFFAAQLQSLLGTERSSVRVLEKLRPDSSSGMHEPKHGRRRAMTEGKEFVPGMYRSVPQDKTLPGWAYFVSEIRLKDGQVVIFETSIPKDATSLPSRLLITLAVLLLIVLLLSFIAVRWMTRPLDVLASAAEELGKDIHRPPLPETGPTEVARAAHAFNTMQTRLLRFIEDRSRIFSAMSHDLKTPITRLRLRAELLEDEEQRQRFEKDLKEMEAMVIESLDFMRGLEGSLNRQPVDIMALLESLQADCAEMGQTINIEGKATNPFIGIAPLLKRGLANLLENAIAYGKQADVVIEDSAERLVLRIRDHGPGIPECEQENVFEPFCRLESSRNRETGGTGLGLTIARSIIQTHDGTITLMNHPEGGLEVTLSLPRA